MLFDSVSEHRAFGERVWSRRRVPVRHRSRTSISVLERRGSRRAIQQRVSCLYSCMPGCARCIRQALGTCLFNASLSSRPAKK